jgi:transcriptional regulator with AAA-type ATPase domain
VQNELLDRMTKFEQKQTEKRVAGQLDESKLYGALADYDGGKINKQCDALMRNVFYFCNKAGYPSLFSQLREAEQALVERRAKRARTATAADDNDEEDDAESSGFN